VPDRHFREGLSQQTAPDDVILRAMHDEIDRSRQLRVIGGSDEPILYSLRARRHGEFSRLRVDGSAVTPATPFRIPNVKVRVGNYDFDDTGHIYSGIYSGSRMDGEWPARRRYPTLRDCLWLATDRAYKTAIESDGAKTGLLE